MIRLVMFAFLSALAFSGLAQSPDKLGPGDTVHITVFQQPDMTTDTRVTESGTVNLPLVGAVKVDGMSTAEAAEAIQDALKKGEFLKSPKVTVALTTVRSRQVSGSPSSSGSTSAGESLVRAAVCRSRSTSAKMAGSSKAGEAP